MRTTLLTMLAIAGLAAAEPVNDIGSPASSLAFVAPLSIDEAQRWHLFCQVKPVMEKDSVLVDSMEAKNQMLIVHSITYFRGSGGQMYAVITYLRPRLPPEPAKK